MNSLPSIVQILTVENETRKSKKTGADYVHHVARAILLNDDGAVVTVGSLKAPPSLRDQIKVGTFRIGYTMSVPDFGENQGLIVPVITSLIPVTLPRIPAVKPGTPAP